MLALLPFIFGNWLIAAIMVHVIAFAFYMGVAYLGGKLFGPDMPETDSGPTANAQSRSWNPHSTQQEGLARPRAYGRNMHHGNIVAKWTEVVDNREKLYMIVEYGDGPTKGVVYEDGEPLIFLNDQPIGNFTSVDTQERLGTLNQTCMTGFEKTKLEYPQSTELLKNEPIIVTTPNDYFDDLEYTILFPNGLRKYHKSGDADYSACQLKVRIREHPDGYWTKIFNKWISACTLEPYFLLYKVNTLEPGYVERGKQYDLEFTNLTGSGRRTVNDVYLKSYREVVDIAFTRPGKVLVGIRAVATEALSGSLDVKVVREDKIIWTWDGTSEDIKYSRNRAWVDFDVLTQPVISGDGSEEHPWKIEHYEGIDPSRLNLEFFYNWAEFCSTQVPSGYGAENEDRIACDTILDFQTDVWTFANEIANVGRAHLYWQGHILTGWIDRATAVSGLVTMDNVMARSWKSNWSEKDELAGKVEVFFNDSRQGYERTHAALPNEDAGRYTRIISVEGIGITTRGTAIHVANHALLRNKLIRNVNPFRQYKEAFRYHLGDVIRLQIPRWGKSYRVRSSADNKVKLNRICDAGVGEHLFIQSYDEAYKKIRVDRYTVLSVAGKIVTINGPWNVTPKKNYMVAIGEEGGVKLRRITHLDFRSDNYVDVTVETYDPDLFTADALIPDLPDQNYIWSQPANPLQRPVTRAEVIKLIGQLAIPQLDVDSPHTSNCKWTGSLGTTVAWGKTDIDEPIVFRYKGVSYEIEPDSTTEEFIYWDPGDPEKFNHTNTAAVAVLLGRWYMCRNVAGVAYPTTPFSSIHAGVIQVGTMTAAQIIIGGINALALKNAPAEAGADVTAGKQAASIVGQGALATQGQGDISLANLGEKSIDSLVNGTYAKMLANWRQTGNLTFINGGKIYTGSILAEAIKTYNLTALNAVIENLFVKTAHIKDLNVTTIKIADEATQTVEDSYTETETDYIAQCASLTTIQSKGIASVGGIVDIIFEATFHNYAGASRVTNYYIYRDAILIYEGNLQLGIGSEERIFDVLFDVPGAGDVTYYLKACCTVAADNIKAQKRRVHLEESKGK